MTKQDVINAINQLLPDNNEQLIDPADLREGLNKILDYAEGLDLGQSQTDLDATYRRKDDSYSKAQIDAKFSEVDSSAPFINAEKHWVVGGEDTGVLAEGQDGVNGLTPRIEADGNWWIGTTDTGVKAAGVNGLTPRIETDGNWWIGTTDTGVKAAGNPGANGVSIEEVSITEGHLIVKLSNGTEIDAGVFPATDFGRVVSRYQGQFTGVQNGVNTVFIMPDHFVPGTVKVFRDGVRLSAGGGHDYVEGGINTVILTEPPATENMLIFEYIRA